MNNTTTHFRLVNIETHEPIYLNDDNETTTSSEGNKFLMATSIGDAYLALEELNRESDATYKVVKVVCSIRIEDV